LERKTEGHQSFGSRGQEAGSVSAKARGEKGVNFSEINSWSKRGFIVGKSEWRIKRKKYSELVQNFRA